MPLPRQPALLGLGLALALAGCVVIAPVATGPLVVGQTYPGHPDAGPAPATSRCARPARAEAAAGQIVARINAERRTAGLGALRRSAPVTRAAQAHACDNATRASISHQGSDGADLGQRLRREGLQLATAAENTGLGFDSPDQAIAFWLKSPGHRANILNPAVTDVGVGLADGARPAWVLVLAKPR